METPIGQVTHYYNHLGVAVVKLDDGLQVGDKVHIRGHGTDFVQTVESIQVEHQTVQSVGRGAEAALKVDQRVHEGDQVYKLFSE